MIICCSQSTNFYGILIFSARVFYSGIFDQIATNLYTTTSLTAHSIVFTAFQTIWFNFWYFQRFSNILNVFQAFVVYLHTLSEAEVFRKTLIACRLYLRDHISSSERRTASHKSFLLLTLAHYLSLDRRSSHIAECRPDLRDSDDYRRWYTSKQTPSSHLTFQSIQFMCWLSSTMSKCVPILPGRMNPIQITDMATR